MSARAWAVLIIITIFFCSDGVSLYAQKGFKVGEKAKGNLVYRKNRQLAPLFEKMGKPKKGEWLYANKEKGQTYKEYVASRPGLPRGRRKLIYIQPIGKLNDEQHKVVEKTVEFIQDYFGMEVKMKLRLPLNIVPPDAQRTNPVTKNKQLLTNYIIYKVLEPRVPEDAFIYLAFTASDLWAGEANNYTLGQASTANRVGVWSLYRSGAPGKGKKEFALCLLRTIKTACHEISHMLGLTHCTAFKCEMNGSTGRDETDARPLAMCPECLTKICLIGNMDPLERFKKLKEFCEKNNLKEEAEFYGKCIEKLSK